MPERIAVTGAAGFVGRAVVARLKTAGLAAVAIDRLPGDGIVAGDLTDPGFRREALAGTDAVIHLAAIPGGAAEADPALSRRINLDLTLSLMEEAPGRFVYASSIAVFGAPLPDRVDDKTPARPALTYGAHKLMCEIALADRRRRGLEAIALRLPGIVARPRGAAGMKSAFMNDVFHALAAKEPITLPVSPRATMWMLSAAAVAEAFVHALTVENAPAVLTLPALRARMDELVAALDGTDLVAYAPDPVLEAQFGAYPPLGTRAADKLGFRHDGDLATLIARALS